jgi:hypothetical protein
MCIYIGLHAITWSEVTYGKKLLEQEHSLHSDAHSVDAEPTDEVKYRLLRYSITAKDELEEMWE